MEVEALKRSGPIARHKPLRRSKPMRKRAPRRGDCPEYLQAVRELGYCCAGKFFGREQECFGRLDPHHAGRRPGVGLKASDTTAIPLCRWHHDAAHGLYGPFHHWDKAKLREWMEFRIGETLAAVALMLTGGRVTPQHAAKCVSRFRWRQWSSWAVMAWIRRKGLSCVEVFRQVGA